MATDNRTIKYSFWLRFSRGGAVHATKGQPSMGVDERSMQCNVELPLSLFIRPQMTANIVIGELPERPFNIDIKAAETALSEVLGAQVIFTVTPPDEVTP